jgi:hypothetical protein
MSNQNNDQSLEVKNKVVVAPEDCNAALDFWRHFNIPIPAELQSSIDAFSTDPSFANQEKIKLEICKAISMTDHEAFKDDMFSKIAAECENTTFEMQFDKDFEEEVSVKE